MMSLSFFHSELLAYFHGLTADIKKKKKGKVKENKCVLSTWSLPTIWNNCYELICCLLQIAVNICAPNRCSPCFGGLFPNYPHMLYSLCEFHIANFHPSGFFFFLACYYFMVKKHAYNSFFNRISTTTKY